jgi:aspartate/methionine/tyrosine aminotransferase
VFWSLYGVDRNAATAIGDFVSKAAAHETMNAILAIPAAARNALQDQQTDTVANHNRFARNARVAADWLDDMINQSSNLQRI